MTPTAPPLSPEARLERDAVFWIQFLLFTVIGCQLVLVAGPPGWSRVLLRTAPFAVSLAELALVPVPRRFGRHPARPLVAAWLALIGLGVFHPSSGYVIAGVAQFALSVAIAAPLFWAARLTVTPRVLARMVLIIWSFNALSATVGVLQVLFPGRFDFAVSSVVANDAWAGEHLKITLGNGTQIYRPSGLSDVPGGAAGAGLTTLLFGLGYLTTSRSGAMRALAALSIGLGLFATFFTQVRVVLVIAVIVVAAYAALLTYLRRGRELVWLVSILPLVVGGSFAWAVAEGGDAVVARLQTLVEERPDQVYYSNRGKFFEATLYETLPEFPLGGGIGRYGMMYTYFGDDSDLRTEPLWAEIQWTSWAYDGGAPLMLVGLAALVVAMAAAGGAARRARSDWLAGWAALVAAYDLSMIGLTFSYSPFAGQTGLEYWLLNGTLFAAYAHSRARPPVPGTAGGRA